MSNNTKNQGGKTRFEKGLSGNPSGRPPKPKLPDDVRAALYSGLPKEVETLISAFNSPRTSLEMRVRIAENIVARFYGKNDVIIEKGEVYDPTTQTFDIPIDDDLSFINFESGDTDETLS